MNARLDHPVYFLTWTTYGSWLHGDQRGSVDRDHNLPTSPFVNEHLGRNRFEAELRNSNAVLLNIEQRKTVEQAIQGVIEHKQWRFHALNCRSNHVHVVVFAGDRSPESVMNSFKSWASRMLNEQCGKKRKWWTRHGSTRYLNDVPSVIRAIDYVNNHQDEPRPSGSGPER